MKWKGPRKRVKTPQVPYKTISTKWEKEPIVEFVKPKPTKQNPNPLEKVIETKVCDYAKSLGVLCYKFTSPARRSVPDRLFILPHGKGVFFIEFKRKGCVPSLAQAVEIEKIRKQGVTVLVIDNVLQGKVAIDTINLTSKREFPSDVNLY